MPTLDLKQIIKLASDQFQVPNATETITAVPEISDVFSPPHHGPKNIPIAATTVGPGDYNEENPESNYTHFPIVNSGYYCLFLTNKTDHVKVQNMHYHGPSQQDPAYYPIALSSIPQQHLKETKFAQGFSTKSIVIFNQGDPQPIATHFNVNLESRTESLNYIVVGPFEKNPLG